MLRVLFLTHNFPRHDSDVAGSFLLRLAVALRDEQGITVDVLAPAAPGLPPRDVIAGIAVERFRYAPNAWQTLAYTGNMAADVASSWRARLALLGMLANELATAHRAAGASRPAVLHAHWWFPSGVVGAAVSRMRGLPLVTTLHGSDVRLAKTLSAARPLAAAVFRQSRVVTAVSSWLAREAAALVPHARPTVLPMPVPTDVFAPDDTPRGDRLLFVGRLSEQKGLGNLLRALALAERRVELDIVGEGSYESTARAIAESEGVADRVRWLGSQTPAALAALYRLAAALVVPSVDEGLGLVAVEALLCETPVIAFDSGGIPDVVRHDETGILVPPGDVAGLSRAIDALYSNRERFSTLARAGRRHALERFSPPAVAAGYAALYRSALDAA